MFLLGQPGLLHRHQSGEVALDLVEGGLLGGGRPFGRRHDVRDPTGRIAEGGITGDQRPDVADHERHHLAHIRSPPAGLWGSRSSCRGW